jgi:nucleotidyltransferase substrate binding protein (TIGR01987 family)
MAEDIRWKQRLSNYRKAFDRLGSAVSLAGERPLTELEEQGLIQAFEFTHELAWYLMKDWFEYQGLTGLTGSRDATREAFREGLVHDGESWMEMIRSRNESSHTYNVLVARKIAKAILSRYWPLFAAFLKVMNEKEGKE